MKQELFVNRNYNYQKVDPSTVTLRAGRDRIMNYNTRNNIVDCVPIKSVNKVSSSEIPFSKIVFTDNLGRTNTVICPCDMQIFAINRGYISIDRLSKKHVCIDIEGRINKLESVEKLDDKDLEFYYIQADYHGNFFTNGMLVR